MFKLNVQQFSDYIQIVWEHPILIIGEMYELNLALIFKISQSIVQDALIPPQMIQFITPHTALYHFEKFYGLSDPNSSWTICNSFSNQILKAKTSLQTNN